MTPVSLRLLALAGMVALLVGAAACAETPEPETPDAQTTESAQGNSIEALRTRANAWDAGAQYNLGLMYDNGEGVPQDDVEAVAWYRRAAEQGRAGAQVEFGLMYGRGRGVPQDYVEAYKWLNLAMTYTDAEDRERYVDQRDSAAARLTPEQRIEGQKRSREYFMRRTRLSSARHHCATMAF